MKKTIVAATAAALLASATFGIAANAPGIGPRERPSPEQMAQNAAAMTDARIAALKAGLHMTPDQEKLWPPIESAMRELARERLERKTAWRAARAERAHGQRPDIIERMRAQADSMLERGDSLKKFVDAADPLYQSLDAGQKWRFNVLLREARGHRFAEWRRGHEGWRGEMRHEEHRFFHHPDRRGGPGGPPPGPHGPDGGPAQQL